MSDINRLKADIANKKSILSGLRDQIRSHHRDVDRARQDWASAGRSDDAYRLQQDADRRVREHQSSISSLERQTRNTENEISGLEAEIRSRR